MSTMRAIGRDRLRLIPVRCGEALVEHLREAGAAAAAAGGEGLQEESAYIS